MPVKINSMLKQILTPVVIVVIVWISMSSATTYYLMWVEKANQRIFIENVTSVRAAESLQINVWRLAAMIPADTQQIPVFRTHLSQLLTNIDYEYQRLRQSATLEEEHVEMPKLDSALNEFLDRINALSRIEVESANPESTSIDILSLRQKCSELANQIGKHAAILFDVNQAVMDRYRAERQRLNGTVIWGRSGAILFGPLIGILLGWRLSLKLDRSIARIAVTLHDADSNSDSSIGVVDIRSTGDFQDVQQQADRVAERMRQVSQELQVARSEILQSERLAAVGELAAGVAHEIRNPLTSVKLLLQHAIRQASGPHLDEGKVRLILEEIGRMETTIQGLLDFSRPPKLIRVKHDLRQTLRRALNLLDARAHQQGIEIVTNAPETPLLVDGDTEKLHQVLVNLLINAVEAMPDGGRLAIDATITTKRQVAGAAQSARGRDEDGVEVQMAQIIMQDTGVGIASEVLPRLFEPFATTKERGTGLGLAVSRRIIEEHSGTIQAQNGPLGGAQFTLTIPIVEAKTRAS